MTSFEVVEKIKEVLYTEHNSLVALVKISKLIAEWEVQEKQESDGSRTTKEKQIQEYESEQLIDELSRMPPMVIATAYLHAINYTLYGKDVTEKWLTATQQACALEKAYNKGYYDALKRQAESEE